MRHAPSRPSFRAPLFLALALLVPGAGLAAQLLPGDALEGGRLLRHEGGTLFEALPGRLSAGLRPELADGPAALLAAAAADPRLADLVVLRANRLGVVDLAFPAQRGWQAVIDGLLASGLVRFVEPVFEGRYTAVPNDAQFGDQWNLANTGQLGGTPGADVNATAAWDIEDGDPSVVVAVLDSGSDWTHADLAASIWSNPGETLNGVDDDGNGFVDDVRGWDFDFNDNDPNGLINHGTSVASVIGARAGNGLDIAGLAGGAVDGQGVSVMPLLVGAFSPNAGVLDDAILYAADNGARVITMSLQIPSSPAVDAAIKAAAAAGVFIDCASGNNGFGVSYPATHPDVMAVASTNRFDAVSGFSNQGPEVEIAAPGENVLMLDLGVGTFTNSGTSFSAPHVAAAAALAFSLNPALDAASVRLLLRDTAVDVGAAPNAQGSGRLDVAALLAAVDGFVAPEVAFYGAGLAGVDGVPVIATRGGLPTLGNASFGVQLAQARPATDALLVVGFAPLAAPFKGGTLLVHPGPPGKLLNTTTSAQGLALIATPLPDAPGLAGAELFLQWAVSDPAAPAGFALSEGLQLTLGG